MATLLSSCSDQLGSHTLGSVKNLHVYWGLYTDGAHLMTKLDITNNSKSPHTFSINVLFLDKNKKIMASADSNTVAIPPGLTQEVGFESPSVYRYHEDDWSYVLSLDSIKVSEGHVPVDFAGTM